MLYLITDNPVLCDDRLFELVNVLENLNARVSGVSTCVGPQTASPVLIRALNDVMPQENDPVIVVAHMGSSLGVDRDSVPQPMPQLMYRRVGALIGHVLPEREGALSVLVEPPITLPPSSTKVVVKWPDEQSKEHAHPLANLRLRELNAAPQ